MSTTPAPVIDLNKLNAFIGQFVIDLGTAVHTGMVVIGEKLGLYKALAEGAMEFRTAGRQDENRRALFARGAGFTSCGRLYHLRCKNNQVQPECRTSLRAGRAVPLDTAVRALLKIAGSRAVFGSPGGRGKDSGGCDLGGVPSLSPRYRNTLQHSEARP